MSSNGDALGYLAARVPLFVRRVLLIGTAWEEADGFRRPWTSAHAVGTLVKVDGCETGAALPDRYYDCVVVAPSATRDELSRAARVLAPQGLVLWPVGESAAHELKHTVENAVPEQPLRLYGMEPHGGEFGWLALIVHDAYNPVEHARALTAQGHPDWGFEVLDRIPAPYLSDPDIDAVIAGESQMCLLAHDSQLAPLGRLEHFHLSQQLLYRAASKVPGFPIPYQCHAEFWHRIGDDGMARRLLRSVQVLEPTESVEQQMDRYTAASPSGGEQEPLSFAPPAGKPHVLFVMPSRPHYGLDVLYDGLCTLLGDERVTEFPWKPHLHGQAPAEFAQYPCTLHRAGKPANFEEIVARLEGHEFDLLLYGSLDDHLDRDSARRIFRAADGLPWAMVDQEDDALDHRTRVLEHLGVASCPAYFKREMLACVDYGPGVFPLPFAYPDALVADNTARERPLDLFWAGARRFGLRRLYLERIERRLGRDLAESYSQADYVQALRSARVGLNVFGMGFDTVRYWEVPAQGCLLLAERPPIRVPYNFVDGESAVFFDDLPDLESKLSACLDDPERTRRLAAKGHECLKQYHTASARAAQLLTRLTSNPVSTCP